MVWVLRRRRGRWLKRILLEKRPDIEPDIQFQSLPKLSDLNSFPEHSQVFCCVGGQDVVGS